MAARSVHWLPGVFGSTSQMFWDAASEGSAVSSVSLTTIEPSASDPVAEPSMGSDVDGSVPVAVTVYWSAPGVVSSTWNVTCCVEPSVGRVKLGIDGPDTTESTPSPEPATWTGAATETLVAPSEPSAVTWTVRVAGAPGVSTSGGLTRVTSSSWLPILRVAGTVGAVTVAESAVPLAATSRVVDPAARA